MYQIITITDIELTAGNYRLRFTYDDSEPESDWPTEKTSRQDYIDGLVDYCQLGTAQALIGKKMSALIDNYGIHLGPIKE